MAATAVHAVPDHSNAGGSADSTSNNNDWFTQDVCITEPLRLSGLHDQQQQPSTRQPGSSTSSSNSSLQLEVSRLAGRLYSVFDVSIICTVSVHVGGGGGKRRSFATSQHN